MAGLCPGSGIFVHLVEPGLNPAFAVLFLRTQNLPHQGSLAGLVQHIRVVTWFLTGAARRLSSLTHDQILLQAGFQLSTMPEPLSRGIALADVRTGQ